MIEEREVLKSVRRNVVLAWLAPGVLDTQHGSA